MNRTKVIGRRRSRSLAGCASKDLCEQVPTTEDPSQRLMMLLSLSFQYALSVIRKDIMSERDFNISEFQENGNECWEKIKSDVLKRNLEKLAVADNGLSDSFRSDNFEDYHKEMALLEKENENWKKEILSYRNGLERSINTPYEVDSSAWKNNEQCYNYSDVLESVSSTHNKLAHQVSSLSETKRVFESCLEADRKFSKVSRLKFESQFQKDASYSPKTLIRKLASARTNVKPYSLRNQLK